MKYFLFGVIASMGCATSSHQEYEVTMTHDCAAHYQPYSSHVNEWYSNFCFILVGNDYLPPVLIPCTNGITYIENE